MNERLERIEDAILLIAEAVDDGEYLDLHTKVGEILFGEIEELEETL